MFGLDLMFEDDEQVSIDWLARNLQVLIGI